MYNEYFIRITGVPAPKKVIVKRFEDKEEKEVTEPEDIRRAWPNAAAMKARMSLVAGVFEVDAIDGIDALKDRSPEAAIWWGNTNIIERRGVFTFSWLCCEVVDTVPQFSPA